MGSALSRKPNKTSQKAPLQNKASTAITIGSTLSFVSYNVWFDPKDQPQRTEALLAELERLSPDFIGLQELTHQTFPTINARLSTLGYQAHDQVSNADRYFACLWTKLSWKSGRTLPFPTSNMGRKLCVGEPDVVELPLVVATSHWESLNFKSIRMEQLAFGYKELASHENAIMFGDTNWYNGFLDLPEPWKDAWLALGREDGDGLTFDGKVIGYAAPYRSRLDRFLVKLVDFELVDLVLLGTTPIAEKMWISDHAGLHLTLRRIERK